MCNVSRLIRSSIRVCPSVGSPSIIYPRIVTRGKIEIMTGGHGSTSEAADQGRMSMFNICRHVTPT